MDKTGLNKFDFDSFYIHVSVEEGNVKKENSEFWNEYIIFQ